MMVGRSTGCEACQCRRAQVSELFSMEICDLVEMAFLAATDVGKFPPGSSMQVEVASLLHYITLHVFCELGRSNDSTSPDGPGLG